MMAKKKLMLDVDTTVEDALTLVKDGKVTIEAYSEWDADRLKRLTPKSNGRAGDGSCEVTREFFKGNAKAITLTIEGHSFTLEPRDFSTGSFGWSLNGKVPVKVGGTEVKVQAVINLMVANSKKAK